MKNHLKYLNSFSYILLHLANYLVLYFITFIFVLMGLVFEIKVVAVFKHAFTDSELQGESLKVGREVVFFQTSSLEGHLLPFIKALCEAGAAFYSITE